MVPIPAATEEISEELCFVKLVIVPSSSLSIIILQIVESYLVVELVYLSNTLVIMQQPDKSEEHAYSKSNQCTD